MHPREYEAELGFRENKESLHSSPNAAAAAAACRGIWFRARDPKSTISRKRACQTTTP